MAPKPVTPGKKAAKRILFLTGDDYPGHKWRLTTPALRGVLEKDKRFEVRVIEDPEAALRHAESLASYHIPLAVGLASGPVLRFQRGDVAGFEALMERYRHRAYGMALGYVGNHDDAMDTVQKVFLRIHRSLVRFRAATENRPHSGMV